MILYGESEGRRCLRAIGVPPKIAQDTVSMTNIASISNLTKSVPFLLKEWQKEITVN
jgi:hypothetical protein